LRILIRILQSTIFNQTKLTEVPDGKRKEKTSLEDQDAQEEKTPQGEQVQKIVKDNRRYMAAG
jgi:hypothetical protein